jgi:Protein of unknown function (DUF2924)
MRSLDGSAIEAKIVHVRSLGVDALRAEWRAVFGRSPPEGLTKDILARMIAYRIQEQALGRLDRETSKLLTRLVQGENSGTNLNRRLKAGTVLVREYQGERHTVTVARGGFLWHGTTHPSLSSIARAITGTAWNGPRFFGLRVAAEDRSEARSTAPGLARARKQRQRKTPSGGD